MKLAFHLFFAYALTLAFTASLHAAPTEQTVLTGGGFPFGSGYYSVAISGDTLVAGALDTGAAYVYVRNGSTWNQQAVLTPSNAGGSFGESVAISGDLIIIGAPRNAATARA